VGRKDGSPAQPSLPLYRLGPPFVNKILGPGLQAAQLVQGSTKDGYILKVHFFKYKDLAKSQSKRRHQSATSYKIPIFQV